MSTSKTDLALALVVPEEFDRILIVDAPSSTRMPQDAIQRMTYDLQAARLRVAEHRNDAQKAHARLMEKLKAARETEKVIAYYEDQLRSAGVDA